MSYWFNDFYITVNSRDSKNYSPDNTQFDFYAKLPRTIELNGQWNVCINQIWIDKMWYNIKNIQIGLEDNNNDTTYINLTDGYYDTVDKLIDEINMKTKLNNVQVMTCIYNDITHKISVTIIDGYKVHISPELSSILGSKHMKLSTNSTLDKCVDLFFFERILYVYTDMIQGDIYSNSEHNVLKLISPYAYAFGDVIYDNVITNYNRVSIQSFDMIHVEIKNCVNDTIKDCGGSTTVQLHFKRY